MKRFQKGFTFVELIIVLVIIAILSTIGFVTYESYLGGSRDTNRVVQLKGLHQSFGVYSATSQLPIPASSLNILSSGNPILYQGNLDESIASTIGFRGEVYDSIYDIYPTYVLSENRKDFQIVTYLEDQSTLQAFTPGVSAFTDFHLLYAANIGKPLGALHDLDTQTPIHGMDSYSGLGVYDVISGTGSLTIYFSDDNRIDSEGTPVLEMIPNRSCQKILESGASRGDGEYTLSPTGIGTVRTYCDMTIAGGGWTFISYVDTRNTSTDLFSSDIGSFRSDRNDSDISDDDSSYSINGTVFEHREMMIALDEKENISAAKSNKLLFLQYNEGNGYMNNGPLPCIGDSSYINPYLRAGLSGKFEEIDMFGCGGTEVRGRISGEIAYGVRSGGGLYHGNYVGGSSNFDINHSARIYVR